METIGQALSKIHHERGKKALTTKTILDTSNPLRQHSKDVPQSVQRAKWSAIAPKYQQMITAAYQADRWPILFHGAAGQGKTCAMSALYQCYPGNALWLSFQDEVRRLTAAWRDGLYSVVLYGPNGPRRFERPPESIIERIARYPFVAMDDLGTRAPTDSQYDAIYAFIAAREGRPTAYTTNLSPAALAKVYDDRIVSRLLAGTVIEIDDVDRRLEA